MLAAGRAPASSPSPDSVPGTGARASHPWASPPGHAAQVCPPRLSLPPPAPRLAWVCPAFNQLGKPAPVACPSAPGVLEAGRGGSHRPPSSLLQQSQVGPRLGPNTGAHRAAAIARWPVHGSHPAALPWAEQSRPLAGLGVQRLAVCLKPPGGAGEVTVHRATSCSDPVIHVGSPWVGRRLLPGLVGQCWAVTQS